MWPFIWRLGLVALAGVGLGFLLLSQQEALLFRDIPNGRERDRSDRSNRTRKRNSKQKDEECQRQALEDQLNSGTAECVICTECMHYSDEVWPCHECRNIFHLKCIKQWGNINAGVAPRWNCPVCRKTIFTNPNSLTYKCMCGRIRAPKPIDGVTPHCCGQQCSRGCGNKCHPGPCSRK